MPTRQFGFSKGGYPYPQPMEGDLDYDTYGKWCFFHQGQLGLSDPAKLGAVLGRKRYHGQFRLATRPAKLYGCVLVDHGLHKGVTHADKENQKPRAVAGFAALLRSVEEEVKVRQYLGNNYSPTTCIIDFTDDPYHITAGRTSGIVFRWAFAEACSDMTIEPAGLLPCCTCETSDCGCFHDETEENDDSAQASFESEDGSDVVESRTDTDTDVETEPAWYFFYGTLKDNIELLQKIIKRADIPLMQQATVAGYEVRNWGPFAAMVARAGDIVQGTAIEIEGQAEPERLQCYEGKMWWRNAISIQLADGSEVEGYAFLFNGDHRELGQSRIGQDDWVVV